MNDTGATSKARAANAKRRRETRRARPPSSIESGTADLGSSVGLRADPMEETDSTEPQNLNLLIAGKLRRSSESATAVICVTLTALVVLVAVLATSGNETRTIVTSLVFFSAALSALAVVYFWSLQQDAVSELDEIQTTHAASVLDALTGPDAERDLTDQIRSRWPSITKHVMESFPDDESEVATRVLAEVLRDGQARTGLTQICADWTNDRYATAFGVIRQPAEERIE